MTPVLERPAARAAASAYANLPRPLFTRLPFDYRVVPPRIRTAGLRLLARLTPMPSRFPSWPIEPSLDTPQTGGFAAPFRAGLVLTHDIDTRAELELVEPIRSFERACGAVSAWGFVPSRSWPTEEGARGLAADGCEVYWHDLRHDGKLAFQPLARIRAAFARVDEASPWATELIQSFRSGHLLMTPDLMTAIDDRFAIDLSIPDTERHGPYGGTAGCGTVVPFLIGRCLEIPLSLPQDVYMRHVDGFDAIEALRVWQSKVEHIVSMGGVAVLNTHPVWVNPWRTDMWQAYRSFLEWAIDRGDLLVTTPGAIRRLLIDDVPRPAVTPFAAR